MEHTEKNMMDLRWFGKDYKQVEAKEICDGCSFYNEGEGECKLYNSLGKDAVTDLCCDNETIWIEKNNEKETDNFMVDLKERTAEFNTEPVPEPTGVKHDQEKERYDLIPVLALEEVAKVLTAGGLKYNEDYNEENWRKVPNAERRYFSATMRHLAWIRKGQTHDGETKLHHYAHAITNLMFLLEKELESQLGSMSNKC